MNRHWISMHIFYYGDQNALLIKNIAPLVAELRRRGLIRRYFFIKYWEEGFHIRLRLLPVSESTEEVIKLLAKQAVTTFLHQQPGLYTPDPQQMAPYYKKIFISEYGEERWLAKYGEDGAMPTRLNNTFAYIDYEPEYDRYGGVDGVELAEWHFEHSSDVVLGLLREGNMGVQSILLGTSIQLSLPFFYGMFEQDESVLGALERYIRYWRRADARQRERCLDIERFYEKKYLRVAPILRQRVAKIRQYMLTEVGEGRLTATEYRWKKHICELRQRINELFTEGKIIFDEEGRAGPVTSLNDVYHTLQGSYIHMTNNRLGVSIDHEVYIAYLLKRSLEDLLSRPAKGVVLTKEVTAQ